MIFVTIKVDEYMNIWIDRKVVYFTLHVRDEIDEYGKDTLFVCSVIDEGERKLVSKKEKRYESGLRVGNTTWIVAWFDLEDRILVKHFGKRKR